MRLGHFSLSVLHCCATLSYSRAISGLFLGGKQNAGLSPQLVFSLLPLTWSCRAMRRREWTAEHLGKQIQLWTCSVMVHIGISSLVLMSPSGTPLLTSHCDAVTSTHLQHGWGSPAMRNQMFLYVWDWWLWNLSVYLSNRTGTTGKLTYCTLGMSTRKLRPKETLFNIALSLRLIFYPLHPPSVNYSKGAKTHEQDLTLQNRCANIH